MLSLRDGRRLMSGALFVVAALVLGVGLLFYWPGAAAVHGWLHPEVLFWVGVHVVLAAVVAGTAAVIRPGRRFVGS